MGLYGGRDKRINATLKDLVEAMAENEKDFQMKIFPGASHAFFNDTNPVNYNASAAKEAWPMVLDFFRRKLAS
jgi:carboxymethylenebutenolidase